MKVLYNIFLISLLMLIAITVSAQEKRLKKADEIFEAGEYWRAIQEYNSVMKKVENKSQKNEIYFKIGECYFMIGDYKKARTNFKKTAKVDDFEVPSKIRLAEIEIQEGTFEEALVFYNEVLLITPNDSIALKGIESANLAILWMTLPTRYKHDKAKEFNTKRNEFSPSVDEKSGYDHVYFSSTRDEAKGKKTSGITGEKFSDLFVAKLDRKQEWTDAVPVDSLNTEFDEGTPCIFDEGRKFYYTSCRSEKGKKVGCQIYEAMKVEGEWMNPVNLSIVPDSISIGHPAVSPDGKIIFFSARMQGGFGGADIWFVEEGPEGWTKPKNMGPVINSTGDELFPFMRADETFFYSSTKHPTMGGLDIFIAIKNEKGRWESENMKPPFSSNGNDFGIYYYSDQDKGYFTSDRKGSKQEDIYWFVKPPLEFKLTGTAKDKDKSIVIDSCVVMLFGSDGSVFRDTTSIAGKEGKFNFKLKPKTDYVFVVTKDGYFNGKSRFTTDSLEFDKIFEYEILLESLNKTFEIPNIEFEFGKWDLTQSSKYFLDSLVKIMIENPYLVIEMSAHTDMIGTDEANNELSQKRANSVTSYFKSKGIPEGRLIAKGYGKTKPKVIITADPRYSFLPVGTVLSEDFVKGLTPEQQVVANQQNRRIEMKVLSNDYVPSLD
jgi:peptidoglycan-associated lipoprotein